MKCTSRLKTLLTTQLLVLVVLFCTACGDTGLTLSGSYDLYSVSTSVDNTELSSAHYFASDLCVTDGADNGTEKTDSQVATSAACFNITTNELVYSQNIFETIYPASTTKILTAYIIFRDCNLDDVVTVTDAINDLDPDSSVCGVSEGDQITVRDLLYGLLLISGNDAAVALAVYHSGSVDAFAEEMNETAASLGATSSHFVNPHGLDDENHYTTAYDMYLIFSKLIEYDEFLTIAGTVYYTASFTGADGNTITKDWTTTNRFLTGNKTIEDGFTVLAGKTGTTGQAGYCLVLLTENEKQERVISIVYKADSSWNLYLLMNQILAFAK